MTKRITVQVDCDEGYKGEQTPRAFTVADRKIDVTAILDQWLAPDHRYFKVTGDDGGLYILRHDVPSDEWEITLSEWTR